MDSVGEGECQPLIDVLLDRAARWDERDDAAADLADADEPEALEALMRVGRDEEEDETLLETVGEAIAEILSRHPERATDKITSLPPAALRVFRERRSRDRKCAARADAQGRDGYGLHNGQAQRAA